MDYNFDPITGQPLYKFDPETGAPLTPPEQNAGGNFDPETGAPVNAPNGAAEPEAVPQTYPGYGYVPAAGAPQDYNPNPGYDPNAGGYYAQPQQPAKPGQGFAIAGMVLGIASVVPFLWYFSLITGILGIVFGMVAKNKGNRTGMATAGIVCGIIGVSLFLLVILIGASCVGAAFNMFT